MGHFWSVAKGTPRFGCAKQSNNLKRYLIGMHAGLQAGTKQLCRAGLGLGEKKSRYRIFAQISSSTKSVGKLAKPLWILKERKEKKTLNPTWSTGGSRAHCSYLEIYISQKISLCKGDFEGKFQTSVQTSIINFLIWKFRFIIINILLFF